MPNLTTVSLAKTDSEKREAGRPMSEGSPPENMEDYPYGLTLHLSTAELRKLGYGQGQLKPGDKVNLVGTGMITTASVEMINTLESPRASLQVQTLGLQKQEEEGDRLASTIYGA